VPAQLTSRTIKASVKLLTADLNTAIVPFHRGIFRWHSVQPYSGATANIFGVWTDSAGLLCQPTSSEGDDANLGQEGQVVFEVPVFGDAVVFGVLDVEGDEVDWLSLTLDAVKASGEAEPDGELIAPTSRSDSSQARSGTAARKAAEAAAGPSIPCGRPGAECCR
jgi:hypothetical protein